MPALAPLLVTIGVVAIVAGYPVLGAAVIAVGIAGVVAEAIWMRRHR